MLVSLVESAETIALFCRINVHTRRNLPVRSSEMGLLIYLVKGELTPTPIKIAEFFEVTKPMVTAMIKSLSKEGYLQKVPSTTDGRSYALKPTEKAVQLVERTYLEYCRYLNLLMEKMGRENFETLVRLLGSANLILLEERKNG